MAQQKGMSASLVRSLASPTTLANRSAAVRCRCLDTNEDFEGRCSVFKVAGRVDCSEHPHRSCPVKVASAAFRRMGDMGKLPVSALRAFGGAQAFEQLLAEAIEHSNDPLKRANLAVARIGEVWRVGEKLANLFVSALSTPALAPGLTPWHPVFDGNQLVVIDTNVARTIDVLAPNGERTYSGRGEWLGEVAGAIDLREFEPALPSFAPRLVQQAMYYFASDSNRGVLGLGCRRERACTTCAPATCLVPRAA